jgi:hypothetical protein
VLLFQNTFSFLEIKPISPRWCTPLAGNPLDCALAWKYACRTNLQHCRMMWEDYFTFGTKPRTRKVGSFTTELISRVLDSKPSKLIVLKSSNANKIIIQNE